MKELEQQQFSHLLTENNDKDEGEREQTAVFKCQSQKEENENLDMIKKEFEGNQEKLMSMDMQAIQNMTLKDVNLVDILDINNQNIFRLLLEMAIGQVEKFA